MARIFILALILFGAAHANSEVEARLTSSLRSYSALPNAAVIEITSVTPVRGKVDRVIVSNFDRRTGEFSAMIGFGQTEARIRGTALVSIPVVVPVRTLQRSVEVRDEDISVELISLSQVPTDAFYDLSDVVGKEIRRSVIPGRPIRERDVTAPVVIKKNGTVDIIYETPGISLSTRGRALEEGAIGDYIRVTSGNQGRIVTGEIVSQSRVVVK
ncbi:MAG: flagellar basal body P-ring formation chaperone FlgA [Pseudomonadota bacterium]